MQTKTANKPNSGRTPSSAPLGPFSPERLKQLTNGERFYIEFLIYENKEHKMLHRQLVQHNRQLMQHIRLMGGCLMKIA